MLILLDITARNQMQRELKREAELTRILIDHAPVSIGLLGTDGSVLRVNAAAEKLFGYKLKEVAGHKVWTLPVVDAAEASASQRRIEMLADGGGSIHFTRPMHTRDGGTRHIEIAHTAVKKADGSVDFIVTTGVDATERRKLEVEVIRVAEQEHIRIGHDLHDGVGQTLTGIASLVEALLERLSGEDHKDARRIHELVKTAITETRRLSHGLSPAAVKNRGLAGGLMLIAETVRENFRRE
jgi:PAS domain S-box-containing protein